MSPPRPSFTPGRPWWAALDAVMATAGVLALVVLTNYLAATGRVWRRDLGAGNAAALSPLTLQTLSSLTNDVKVTVLFARDSGLFTHIESLLRQYSAESRRVLPRYVDPVRDAEVAMEVRRQYQLGSRAGQVVVFEARGRTRVVGQSELSEYNPEDVRSLVSGRQVEVRRSAFLGELRFTAALAALADVSEIDAAVVEGHGEHPFDSEEPVSGYASFARLLASEKNLSLHHVDLSTNDLPRTCRLAILAGPTGRLLPLEIDRLDRFLNRGGSVLVLLHPYAVDSATGLEPWLLNWGVAAPAAYAADPKATVAEFDLLTRSFGSHPIMVPLRRSKGTLYFPLPRIVLPAPSEHAAADAPKAEALVTTSDTGMTKSDLKDGRIGFDPARDRKDVAAPLAVAVERGGVSGVAASRGAARLVVIGDSIMFGNKSLDNASNRDFAALCVSWLLDRPTSLAIGPRPVREWRVNLTPGQWRDLRWTLLGAMPGGALLAGLLAWMRGRG